MNLVRRLQSAIREERRRVVVIGDAMHDLWVYGRVEACQDNCTKFIEELRFAAPGGAANAQRSVEGWGNLCNLYTYPQDLWPTKCRFVMDDGRITWRWDDDEVHATRRVPKRYKWAYEMALESVESRTRTSVGAVLLCDYDKGFLTPEFIRQIVDLCRERGIPCVADLKRSAAMFPGCVLKCNSQYQHVNNGELSELVYDADCGESLVVTCGADTPAVWDRGVLVKGFPFLPAVECRNHVGAGDCFAAHLALALAYGFSLKDAAAVAHSAGRVYVQSPHNRPPLPAEIESDLAMK